MPSPTLPLAHRSAFRFTPLALCRPLPCRRLLEVCALTLPPYRAFQASPGASNRRPALSGRGDSAACRPRTAVSALSDAGDNLRSSAARVGAGAGANAAGKTSDEINVADVPINALKFQSVVPPCRGPACWQSHLSHVLDGLSALFSLMCGSATLACMGILEWRSVPGVALRCLMHGVVVSLCFCCLLLDLHCL